MSVKAEMQTLLDAYVDAYMAGDAQTCSSFYLNDGAIYSPYGAPAIGAAAIRKLHEVWLAEGEENKTIAVLEARAEGSLGYCFVKYSANYPAKDGSAATESGTTLNILERQSDGRWLIKFSSLNASGT